MTPACQGDPTLDPTLVKEECGLFVRGDPTDTDGSGAGTLAAPFKTLQAAIYAVPDNKWIFVCTKNTFNEKVTIAKDNVAIYGGFDCQNKASIVGVECIGSIAVLPINVDIKNVGVLDGNKLSVLDNDLNNLSVLDGNILDNNKILNDVEVTVLQDFLNKFLINVSKNDIDVCTTVLSVLFCK